MITHNKLRSFFFLGDIYHAASFNIDPRPTTLRLIADVDRSTPNNWLDDAFWLKLAYHSWRVPLPVNSNWWLLMADDLSIPASVRNSIPAKGERLLR